MFEAEGALEMLGAEETVGATVVLEVGAAVTLAVGELDGASEVTFDTDGALVVAVAVGDAVGASV